MEPDLAAFLLGRWPVVTEAVDWGNGFRFRVAAYLGDELPPVAYVTSVRAVVLRDGLVLVQRDRDGLHVRPGGRREAGEPLEATLHREVREETGWTLCSVSVLGFMRYHHLDPKPPAHPYPHPDFLQVVYAARADTFSADARLDDGYEVESAFRSVAEIRTLGLSRRERVYLDTALKVGGSPDRR